jgi:hypothetical protein
MAFTDRVFDAGIVLNLPRIACLMPHLIDELHYPAALDGRKGFCGSNELLDEFGYQPLVDNALECCVRRSQAINAQVALDGLSSLGTYP